MRHEADGILERRGGKDVIRFQRRIPHPIERVWAAITTPAELLGWWGDAEIDLREGGRFVLRWLNTDDDGNRAEMHATITALEPPRLLETEGDIHGVLRWELDPDGEGTMLTFSSTLDLPEEFRFQTIAGWHFHLDTLGEALDGQAYEWSRWDIRDFLPILHRYQVRSRHDAFIEHWNAGAADAIAGLFTTDGSIVGFDGSTINGRDEIEAHLKQIFVDHQPASYLGKTREIRFLSADVALLAPSSAWSRPARAISDQN